MLVAPRKLGWRRLVTGILLMVPLTSAGEIARGEVNVGGEVGGGWGRLGSLRVNWSVTLLPTEPASSVA